jgi:hypothetical protein
MAKVIQAFQDERGHLHNNPDTAVVADIAAALGRVGDVGGLTNGVAKLILEKRAEIERAFADLDALIRSQPRPVDQADAFLAQRKLSA